MITFPLNKKVSSQDRNIAIEIQRSEISNKENRIPGKWDSSLRPEVCRQPFADKENFQNRTVSSSPEKIPSDSLDGEKILNHSEVKDLCMMSFGRSSQNSAMSSHTGGRSTVNESFSREPLSRSQEIVDARLKSSTPQRKANPTNQLVTCRKAYTSIKRITASTSSLSPINGKKR